MLTLEVFAARARADFAAIGDYIAKDSPTRALSFADELELRCRHLLETPLAYPLVGRKPERGVRRLVHEEYLVFYRVSGDRVVILRVLHGRRNIAMIMRL